MTDQSKAPQLLEREKGREEARQPKPTAIDRVWGGRVLGLQDQLLEAPRELDDFEEAVTGDGTVDARDD